ncbi:MAG: T9SS type A sorting domain-containing protein, partial [Ignavibacteria bacterium]|nr:T9SS type A sorting domain-containing protein [Ignavibacteria bacterium]
NYIDTMQVWVCSDQDPALAIQKLATIRSDDSDNVWKEYKFNLSSFAGQNICIAFRYYMNTTVDGLWCNIDNVFIGNRSAIGITPISNEIPNRFDLKQNYPNPFNPVTNIEFDIAKTSHVTLTIFDITGKEITRLVDEQLNPGSYKVDFNAKDLASGTYLYRITAGDFVKTQKMILTK